MNEFEAAPRLLPLRVLPAIAVINVLVYVAFGLAGHGWESADGEALIRWGSNFGPSTKGDEPWRLASYMALHSGVLHLAVNTFTLVDFGRVCERLFGPARFLVLYLISGVAGGIASVWWNPMVNSVGASGAICGLLGALFVFTLDARNGLPVAALKSQAVGLGVFLAFSIVMSLGNAPIDHAAHFGGLFAGAAAAYVLTPWRRGPSAATGAAGLFVLLALAFALSPAPAPEKLTARQAEMSFKNDLRWFGPREKELLERSKAVVLQWPQASAMKDVRELAAQWEEVHARFTAYRFPPEADQARLHELLVKYIDLRRRAYRALASLPRDAAPAEFERLSHEIKRTVDEINALSKPR